MRLVDSCSFRAQHLAGASLDELDFVLCKVNTLKSPMVDRTWRVLGEQIFVHPLQNIEFIYKASCFSKLTAHLFEHVAIAQIDAISKRGRIGPVPASSRRITPIRQARRSRLGR